MASLTVGYSDSEDRIWVRLVGESAEKRIWLTRRCVLALIERLANRLETSLAQVESILQMESGKRLALEQDEAADLMGSAAPGPAPKSAEYQVDDGGLCTVFDLEIHKERWAVCLHTVSGQPLVFDGTRLQMHQFLKSLLNRQREVGWRLHEPEWLV